MATDESTTHVFASLYTFSDAAKRDVLGQFESSIAARKAECEHDGNQFVIKCAKGDDQALFVFIDLLHKYIQEELDRELDMFEETRIKRLPGTHRKSVGIDPEDTKLDMVHNEAKVDKSDNTGSADQLLINHESISKNWKPMVANERTNNGLHFSAGPLNSIGNVTKCRIELAIDGTNVVVRGESEQNVDTAITKLEVLNSSFVFRMSMSWIFEYYVPEGDLDVLLQMVQMKDSLARKLDTTLFSATSPHVKLLPNYLTIEMVPEDGYCLQPSIRPRPSSRVACRLWDNQPYKSYGDGSYIADIYKYGPGAATRTNEGPNGTPAMPTVPTVDQWVEQSAAAADNPFAPLAPVEEPPEVGVTAEEVNIKHDPPIGRIRHIRTRKAKGIQDLPNVTQSVATSYDGMIPVHSASSSRSPSKSGSKAGEEYDDPRNEDSASTEPSIVEFLVPNRPLVPPPIEPPFMPDPSVASSEGRHDARPGWEAQTVTNVHTNTLLLGFDPDGPKDLHEPPKQSSKVEVKQNIKPFSIVEKLQQVNEVETRQIRHTMNQQKASNQVGSGNTALLRSFESSASQILRCTRSHVGHVKLRANLGRILINHQTGSAEFKKQQFSPSEWPRVFPTQGTGKLDTVFTEMLTASPADADFIVTVKLPSGRPLFDEEPCLRKVTYHFRCKTKSGEELFVEVDEEGKFNAWSAPNLVGALNWHFPKRVWDARLSVTSYEKLDEKYHDEAKGIAANLQISPSSDGTVFGLFTKTTSTELRIRSIMLCRETSHRSTLYPDIRLHLKEVQDLGAWQMTGKRQEYHASAKPQLDMAIQGKLFWEVSISSTVADAILEENETLEIGDLTKWEPKDIVSTSVVKALSSVTKELVTRIDTVGYHNKGPKAGSGTRTSDRVMKDAGFW